REKHLNLCQMTKQPSKSAQGHAQSNILKLSDITYLINDLLTGNADMQAQITQKLVAYTVNERKHRTIIDCIRFAQHTHQELPSNQRFINEKCIRFENVDENGSFEESLLFNPRLSNGLDVDNDYDDYDFVFCCNELVQNEIGANGDEKFVDPNIQLLSFLFPTFELSLFLFEEGTEQDEIQVNDQFEGVDVEDYDENVFV
ncbi:MAG: hypothetical protein EZS28_035561, partial [Streblomastix strix]